MVDKKETDRQERYIQRKEKLKRAKIESGEGSLVISSDDEISIKLDDCNYKNYVTEF